ncbi:hypothetical protein [Actinomadura sp. KC216]|uniref:hypothetical protein n=1 Tax=Actinomadura sp. KC216 TaxID=2530370 RepID=UPI0014052FE1|nr:hypothetical protein [Actinomadura sp. KC216]
MNGRWRKGGRRPARRPRRAWQARRPRSPWVRIGGYGGAVLLAAAALAVLFMPLMNDRKDAGAAGAVGSAGPSAAPTGGRQGAPGGAGPASPERSAPRQDGRGDPYPGGTGGGPEIPQQNGPAEVSWCPRGTAYYRAVQDGVDVVISVSSSGALRAEMSLDGGRSASQQAAVKRGGPHTFHFRGVPPGLVQRVKVTTVSVGVAMQTCYARVAA